MTAKFILVLLVFAVGLSHQEQSITWIDPWNAIPGAFLHGLFNPSEADRNEFSVSFKIIAPEPPLCKWNFGHHRNLYAGYRTQKMKATPGQPLGNGSLYLFSLNFEDYAATFAGREVKVECAFHFKGNIQKETSTYQMPVLIKGQDMSLLNSAIYFFILFIVFLIVMKIIIKICDNYFFLSMTLPRLLTLLLVILICSLFIFLMPVLLVYQMGWSWSQYLDMDLVYAMILATTVPLIFILSPRHLPKIFNMLFYFSLISVLGIFVSGIISFYNPVAFLVRNTNKPAGMHSKGLPQEFLEKDESFKSRAAFRNVYNDIQGNLEDLYTDPGRWESFVKNLNLASIKVPLLKDVFTDQENDLEWLSVLKEVKSKLVNHNEMEKFDKFYKRLVLNKSGSTDISAFFKDRARKCHKELNLLLKRCEDMRDELEIKCKENAEEAGKSELGNFLWGGVKFFTSVLDVCKVPKKMFSCYNLKKRISQDDKLCNLPIPETVKGAKEMPNFVNYDFDKLDKLIKPSLPADLKVHFSNLRPIIDGLRSLPSSLSFLKMIYIIYSLINILFILRSSFYDAKNFLSSFLKEREVFSCSIGRSLKQYDMLQILKGNRGLFPLSRHVIYKIRKLETYYINPLKLIYSLVIFAWLYAILLDERDMSSSGVEKSVMFTIESPLPYYIFALGFCLFAITIIESLFQLSFSLKTLIFGLRYEKIAEKRIVEMYKIIKEQKENFYKRKVEQFKNQKHDLTTPWLPQNLFLCQKCMVCGEVLLPFSNYVKCPQYPASSMILCKLCGEQLSGCPICLNKKRK